MKLYITTSLLGVEWPPIEVIIKIISSTMVSMICFVFDLMDSPVILIKRLG
ncbi:hypothetical protein ACFLS9_03085 [Bacteroidota bacterium]